MRPRHPARHAATGVAERGVERDRKTVTYMPDETPHSSAPEVKTSPAPKDLRVELEVDLKSEFTANLSAVGTLPKVACESLVALLGASGSTSADVIAALALEDSTQPEVPNE